MKTDKIERHLTNPLLIRGGGVEVIHNNVRKKGVISYFSFDQELGLFGPEFPSVQVRFLSPFSGRAMFFSHAIHPAVVEKAINCPFCKQFITAKIPTEAILADGEKEWQHTSKCDNCNCLWRVSVSVNGKTEATRVSIHEKMEIEVE